MNPLPAPVVYALGSMTTRIVSLITLPIIARNLGPEKYGQLDATTILIDLVGLVLGIGLVQAALRYLTIGQSESDDTPDNQRKTTALVTSMMSVTIITGTFIILLITPLIYDYLKLPVPLIAIQCAIVTGASSCYLMLPMMLLRLKSQAWRFISINICLSITQALLMMLSIYFDQGITGLLAAGTITHLCAVIIVTFLLFSELGWHWDKNKAKQLLNYGWPIAVSSFAAFIYNGSERWFLAVSVSASDLGSYSATWKIALFVTIATQPFQLWWSPFRMKLVTKKSSNEIAQYTILGVIWVVSLCLSLIVFAPVLYTLFFGVAFEFDDILVTLLILTVGLRGASDIINIGCFIRKHTRLQMYIQLTTAAITFSLLVILSPMYGNYGVAIAILLGAVYRICLFFIFSQRFYRLKYHFIPLANIFILAILYTLYMKSFSSTGSLVLLLQAMSVFILTWLLAGKIYPLKRKFKRNFNDKVQF